MWSNGSPCVKQAGHATAILRRKIKRLMFYSPIGWVDPWCNVGYFLHYSDPEFGAGYYKAARLSWIIPGFIAYHVFQPIVANYVLHMGCLILSVLFLYLTIAGLFGRAVAFAIAACLSVFIPVHGSGGWDYQNAAAGAFYMIAFYTLTRVVSSKQPRWPAIGVGAAYAAAVHATIGFGELSANIVLSLFRSLPPPLRSLSTIAVCSQDRRFNIARRARSDCPTRRCEHCSGARVYFLQAALGARDIICSRQSNARSMVAAVVQRMVSGRQLPWLSCSRLCGPGRRRCLYNLVDPRMAI
jgi:hypothetical protein